MKIGLPRKWRRQTPIFMAGFGLFALGVLGFVYEAWQSNQNALDKILSDQVVFVAQMSTESLTDIEGDTLNRFAPSWLSDESIANDDLAKWIGSEIALLSTDDVHFILGARYRNKSALKSWLETTLLPEEEFIITKTDKGEVWTPGFSSKQAFLIMDKWVFVGDSLVTLQAALAPEAALADTKLYQKSFSGLAGGKDVRLYVNLESLLPNMSANEDLAVYMPLLSALGQTMPGLGLTGKIKDGQWSLDSQFLMSEVAQSSDLETPKIKNTTIPELAKYAPNDTMFFLNGQEIYARYLHMKSFLKELNPQFELVFDGLLRAQIGRWFGDIEDIESDFLAKITGQYALALNYDDGIDWLLVSDGTAGDEIQSLIQAAQGQFSPQVEVVELPDGTTREELVATPAESVRVETVERNGFAYSLAKSASLNQKQMAFVQQGKVFLVASNRDLLESSLNAKKQESASLSANEDFRKAVLFKLGKAESFMFLNVPKLRKAIDPLLNIPLDGDDAELERSWWQEALESPIRNVIVSRRVETESVIFKWLFFAN